MKGLIRRKEPIDLLLFDHLNGFDHMTQDESVHIDDDREENFSVLR
jgi:hypothetical protein